MEFDFPGVASNAVQADLLVVPCHEGDTPLKGYAFADAVSKLFLKGDFTGKRGQAMILPSNGAVAATRICLLGMGKGEDESVRAFADTLCDVFRGSAIDTLKLKHVAVALEVELKHRGFKPELVGRAVADAAIFGSYFFRRLHTKDKHTKRQFAEKVSLVGAKNKELKAGVEKGATVAKYACLARDLVNEPSNFMKPRDLAAAAKKMADETPGLKCKIIEKPEIEKLKMGSFLGVNAGSDDPARLIVLEYNGGKKGDAPVAFVGKGLCFDTGGYNIKANSLGMKGDMGGGAATIAALGACAALKLPVNVVGVVPATENEISGKAYHPGDILISMSGQTIEVDNTDAEGRLILCDALTYVQRTYKPAVIADMATLTGAAVVAVGNRYVAVMGNDQSTVKKMLASFETVGENAWQLPLPDCYDKLLDSPICDMKNIGGNPGTITAGLFLQRFIDKGQKWLHLDVAGSALYDGENWGLWNSKTPTGSPCRAIVQFAEDWHAANKGKGKK
ncbi:MAG: leucyl aminopeptidase [Planctomycetes bacterium]|nr:leucyl aminopeptidase [Planctomycetota bacterium]